MDLMPSKVNAGPGYASGQPGPHGAPESRTTGRPPQNA
jgi:hypothetical protein